MGTQLDQIYRAYIGALNDRRLDDLDQFVHPRLTYNGQPWIREQYRARLADDVRAIPDLHYDIELLVVDRDHVASRLRFDCTRKANSSALTPADEGSRSPSTSSTASARKGSNTCGPSSTLTRSGGNWRKGSERAWCACLSRSVRRLAGVLDDGLLGASPSLLDCERNAWLNS